MIHVLNGKRVPLCGLDARRANKGVRVSEFKRVYGPKGSPSIPASFCLGCALAGLGFATSALLGIAAGRG